MESKKEGSTAAFVLCLIGGILGVVYFNYRTLGYSFILYLIRIFNPNSRILDGLGIFYGLLLIVLFIILGIIILISSFFMRKNSSLKKSSVIALVASVISFNILGIIGSIIGLLKKAS